MYVAAAVCMWFLRFWKIGQIEQIAAEQKRMPEEIDAASAELVDGRTISFATQIYESGIIKRLFVWKKV